jgi:hypothetical protein
MIDVIFPRWVEKAPAAEKSAARQRFLLHLAAVYASPSGSLRELSGLLGYNPATLSVYVTRPEPIPPKVAIGLENLLGVNVFPRTLTRPDHFTNGK